MPSVETYKIVNATQLDSGLAEIAGALKAKRGEGANVPYTFPQDFKSAIEDLYYDAEPNSASDLSVNNDTVTAAAGFYPNAVSKAVAAGSVTLPNAKTLTISDPVITVGADGKITVSGTVSDTLTPTVVNGYITSANESSLTASVSGELQLTTAPGTAITPSEETQTAIAANTYALGAITINAISSTYIGSDIAQRSNADVVVDGLIVTIPAGYYPEGATVTVEVPEEPAAE